MGIVQVHPEKESLLIVLAQPIERLIRHNVARSFHFVKVRFLQPVELEVVVVEVKAAVQSEARIEHRRGHYSARGVAILFQSRSQGRRLRAQTVSAKVVHSVQSRVSPSEDHSVGWQRDRDWSKSALELNPTGSKSIDIGGVNLLISIAAQVIGTERVNCDNDYVRRSFGRGPAKAY